MISTTYIRDLFTKWQDGKEVKGSGNIEEFYDYLIETEINGQYGQLRELINKMSMKQFKDFIYYVEAEKEIETNFWKYRGSAI